MKVERRQNIFWAFVGVTLTAMLLSLLWRVPYLYTLIGIAVWTLFGHFITADDDSRGGWSNPDGSLPFPWRELAVKAALLAGLILFAVLFPSLRGLGGV